MLTGFLLSGFDSPLGLWRHVSLSLAVAPSSLRVVGLQAIHFSFVGHRLVAAGSGVIRSFIIGFLSMVWPCFWIASKVLNPGGNPRLGLPFASSVKDLLFAVFGAILSGSTGFMSIHFEGEFEKLFSALLLFFL